MCFASQGAIRTNVSFCICFCFPGITGSDLAAGQGTERKDVAVVVHVPERVNEKEREKGIERGKGTAIVNVREREKGTENETDTAAREVGTENS